MATDQGKTANVNAIAAMAALTGRTIDETGTTTYRPPFVPVPMGVIAGRRRGALVNPLRRLPLEAEHRADGAQMREYGGWLRPAWYGTDEPERAIQREAARARDTVALFDGSSLGKIEIIGPDAAALADFHSYNRLSTLKVGRIRYGFVLQESGVVLDDGVTLRLARRSLSRLLLVRAYGCGAHAPRTLAAGSLRRGPCRHSRHDCAMGDAHRHRPALARSHRGRGPRDRARREACRIWRSRPAHSMAAPLRVARVSFTGDRSYELSVPARRAASLRARLVEKLPAFGGGLLGLEALMILRAEKGFIVVGKDTDGTTMPHDLGVTGPRNSRTDEYIGKRSLFMPVADRPAPQAIGRLERSDGRSAAADRRACHVGAGRARRSQGYVTSSYFSPSLGRPIALGLIEAGLSRIGETVNVYHLGAERRATIAAPVALDPEGQRLHA